MCHLFTCKASKEDQSLKLYIGWGCSAGCRQQPWGWRKEGGWPGSLEAGQAGRQEGSSQQAIYLDCAGARTTQAPVGRTPHFESSQSLSTSLTDPDHLGAVQTGKVVAGSEKMSGVEVKPIRGRFTQLLEEERGGRGFPQQPARPMHVGLQHQFVSAHC